MTGITESERFVLFAKEFATRCHKNQVRKYTGEPYINHPAEVVSILEDRSDALWGYSYQTLSGAWLHDVVEDCGIPLSTIETVFGSAVRYIVEGLSDTSIPSDGNRAVRKAIDRKHIASYNDRVHTIKLADMISNSRSIIKHDTKFAKVYVPECRALLESIGGDPILRKQLEEILDNYKEES